MVLEKSSLPEALPHAIGIGDGRTHYTQQVTPSTASDIRFDAEPQSNSGIVRMLKSRRSDKRVHLFHVITRKGHEY
ncbi:hypothetical protein ABIB85_008167 [Bradyrhizobium sp. JR1.5]|uniref:hypothetical protein n=1 Tax=unclassified Bradyrhizobium TaxID=2631580 RepID=UPI0033950F82